MNSDIMRSNNIYNRMKKVSQYVSRGRWYLKDLEQMGAKVTLTPHCTDMGHHQYLYGCQLQIEEKQYYLIVRETPVLSKYIYAVNCKRHPGKEQFKVAEDIVHFFNAAYKENRNGVRTEILKRGFYIITGQIGLLLTWFSTPLLFARFFFTHRINDLALGGISLAIFVVCFVMIFLAKKDSKFGGK